MKIRGRCDNVHHGFGTRRCFASAALDRSCFRWFHPNSTARINGPMMQRCLALIYPQVGSYILHPYSHTDTPEMTLHLTNDTTMAGVPLALHTKTVPSHCIARHAHASSTAPREGLNANQLMIPKSHIKSHEVYGFFLAFFSWGSLRPSPGIC